ncbi:MAG: hypothetical protein KDC58_14145, partial [Cyclobacteriaceae bacterium]|nr:hypothetical protein [Cyclobacteriaceae bacterium]
PKYDKIIKEEVNEFNAIITIEYKNPDQPYSVAVHELHFEKENYRWYLVEVYYVDEDGKYEGL